MQDITDRHLTACVRALLDHVDEHELSFPLQIGKPNSMRWGLLVYVSSLDADKWLASIVTVAEATSLIPGAVENVMSIVHGTLPDTGVRVTINAIRPAIVLAATS